MHRHRAAQLSVDTTRFGYERAAHAGLAQLSELANLPMVTPSPASKAKLGRKRYTTERRSLSFEETARVRSRMNPEERLVIELCIATGVRISEALGLQWKHVNLDAATIRIEQRVWHQEIGPPKTEVGRRVVGLGDLASCLREEALHRGAKPDDWVLPQKACLGASYVGFNGARSVA